MPKPALVKTAMIAVELLILLRCEDNLNGLILAVLTSLEEIQSYPPKGAILSRTIDLQVFYSRMCRLYRAPPDWMPELSPHVIPSSIGRLLLRTESQQ